MQTSLDEGGLCDADKSVLMMGVLHSQFSTMSRCYWQKIPTEQLVVCLSPGHGTAGHSWKTTQ